MQANMKTLDEFRILNVTLPFRMTQISKYSGLTLEPVRFLLSFDKTNKHKYRKFETVMIEPSGKEENQLKGI